MDRRKKQNWESLEKVIQEDFQSTLARLLKTTTKDLQVSLPELRKVIKRLRTKHKTIHGQAQTSFSVMIGEKERSAVEKEGAFGDKDGGDPSKAGGGKSGGGKKKKKK